MMSKLRNETEQLLIEGIRKGLKTDVDLARYARIGSDTLRKWRKLAEEGDKRCQQLVDAMEREYVLRRATIIMEMQRAGNDDWRMWDRLLALSDPVNYGKEIKHEVNNKGALTLRVVYGDERNTDPSSETA